MDADRASLFLVDNKSQEIYARIFDISQPTIEAEVGEFGSTNGETSPPLSDSVQQNQDGRKEIR